MFAIAVWDERRRRARARARPARRQAALLRASSATSLVFASELKSLLASGLVEPELDYEAIDAYLTLGFFPAPRRRSRGVSKLLPGHRLVVDDGGVRIERYWAFPQPALERRGRCRGRTRRAAAREARGVRPAAADERRAARRDAERRPRLEPDRRADGPQHERAGQDVLGRLRRGRRRQRARRRALRRRRASAPTTTSSSSRSRRRPSTSTSSSGTSTSRSPTSRRSASSRSRELAARARHGRALGPGRGRALRRLPEAPRGGARRQLAARCPARSRSPALGCAAQGRRAARAGRSRTLAAARSGGAAARDERPPRRDAAGDARPRPARASSTAARRGARSRARARRAAGRSARRRRSTSTRSSARRRHAPLLRPCVDGALARGPRAVPRPRARRALRARSRRPEGAAARRRSTSCKQAARGLVPDRIIDKPKIGFFNGAVDGWFRAQTRRRDRRLPARARARATPSCSTRRRSASSSAPGERAGGTAYVAALGPDARGLAVDVPAARARRAPAPVARRVPRAGVSCATPSSRPPATRRTNLRAARREPRARRRCCRRPGSSSTTARPTTRVDGRRGACAPARLDRRCSTCRASASAVRGAPDRARASGGPRGARRDRRTSSSSSTPTSRSPPDYFERLLAAFAADPRSGSRAGRCYELERRRVARSGTSPARPSGAPRAPTAGRACRTCCRSSSASAGTASTSSRRTRAAGAPRRCSTCRSATTAARASATAVAWRACARRAAPAHYMGYRPWYLRLRALYHARREPPRSAMIWGYLAAALRARASGSPTGGARLPAPASRASARCRRAARGARPAERPVAAELARASVPARADDGAAPRPTR